MTTTNRNLARIPQHCNSLSDWIDQLPKNPPADLANEHDRRCAICHEDFGLPGQADVEEAVKTDCGHIFGAQCLQAFLSTVESGILTCPTCRSRLPESICTLGHSRTQDYLYFLLWVCRRNRQVGAALDRQYQVHRAIEEANAGLIQWSALCVNLNGDFGSLDEEFLNFMADIGSLDPQDPASVPRLKMIHDRLDDLQELAKLDPDRRSPFSGVRILRSGRRPTITSIFAWTPHLEEVGLEDGEIYEQHLFSRDPGEVYEEHLGDESFQEGESIMRLKYPPWIVESLKQDFSNVPESEIWDELRSRRFAVQVRKLSDATAESLILSLDLNEYVLGEYANDEAYRNENPAEEYHWTLDQGSQALQLLPQMLTTF